MRDAAWISGQKPLKPSEIAIVDGVRDACYSKAVCSFSRFGNQN
jgi:hypothetical protein